MSDVKVIEIITVKGKHLEIEITDYEVVGSFLVLTDLNGSVRAFNSRGISKWSVDDVEVS